MVNKRLTKDEVMAKADMVQARVAQLQSAEAQAISDAISGAFDDGAASVVIPPSGGFQQSDIDAAVAAVVAKDASAMQDLQSKLSLDDAKIADIQKSVSDALQAVISQLMPKP